LYDKIDGNIVRVTMNRPEKRNAQNLQMTYELNAAFDAANDDDDIKVIILAGADPHFSSGHDLSGSGPALDAFNRVGCYAGYTLPGAEGPMAVEEEIFLGMCNRWRNIAKATMAQVQGKTFIGGLMLMWICDLIIASDDATFTDSALTLGTNGGEWFAHPWELGPRKAKEMLFTSDAVSAADAYRLGMVNHVVPRADLAEFTLRLARRIAEKPSFALKMAKESVNQTLDAMGQWNALQAAFSIHTLAHSHNRELFGIGVDPSGLPPSIRERREAMKGKDGTPSGATQAAAPAGTGAATRG
jgi:enoyl-CoA hydratase